MSSTLSKISKNVRKDADTKKGLEKLKKQLRNGEFKSGRGAQKLAGSNSIYYMRSGGKARIFFRCSETERGAIEILAESNKKLEQDVIDNLIQKND